MKKRREYDDDDGRTIADMNIDGMPWYDSRRKKQTRENNGDIPELTPREKRSLYIGAMKAAFLVLLCFASVYFLFIFILTRIWG